LPKIEGDGKSWVRRPKLYKGVVELYKKKNWLIPMNKGEKKEKRYWVLRCVIPVVLSQSDGITM